MKLKDFFVLIWREKLAVQEEKEAFFHGCKRLVQSKSYDRLYRNFKTKGCVLYYSTETDTIYLRTKDDIVVMSDSYYDVFLEIFVDKIYTLPPQIETSDFIVFDVGMNRGYASLFFANKEHCKHVYGFELLETIYETACGNFELNNHLKEKITAYNFGLWNEDSEIEVGIDDCDGHSSIKGVQQVNKKTKYRKALVRKASNVLKDIFNKTDKDLKKVLKIDVEGSEYVIFEDLYRNKLIQEFDMIVGEYHNGIEDLYPYLSDFHCSYIEGIGGNSLGTMAFINNKYSY